MCYENVRTNCSKEQARIQGGGTRTSLHRQSFVCCVPSCHNQRIQSVTCPTSPTECGWERVQHAACYCSGASRLEEQTIKTIPRQPSSTRRSKTSWNNHSPKGRLSRSTRRIREQIGDSLFGDRNSWSPGQQDNPGKRSGPSSRSPDLKRVLRQAKQDLSLVSRWMSLMRTD